MAFRYAVSASECPASSWSMRALTLAAITSFAVCRGLAALFMVFPPVGFFAFAFHAVRGMYLHAERLLAKAGVARRRGRGIAHPGAQRKGEAQRRSAQAESGPRWGVLCPLGVMKRGRLGKPLAPRDR